MRERTDQLGGTKTGDIEEEIPSSVNGVEGMDMNVVDTMKEPKLVIAELDKLKTCEIPCSKDEWRGTPSKNKWESLGNLGYPFRGEKKDEKKEEPKEEVKTAVLSAETPRKAVPPQSAKPPPKPPSTLGHARRAIVDTKGEKAPDKGKS